MKKEIHISDQSRAIELLTKSGYTWSVVNDIFEFNVEQCKLLEKAGVRISEPR